MLAARACIIQHGHNLIKSLIEQHYTTLSLKYFFFSFLSHNCHIILQHTSRGLTYRWPEKKNLARVFFSGFLLDVLALVKSKLSVLWKSSKLIIQYADAPHPAKMTGLTSYRQGWLWSPNPLSRHYTSLSLIRLTAPGKKPMLNMPY